MDAMMDTEMPSVQTASATHLVELVDSMAILFTLKIASLVLTAQMSFLFTQMVPAAAAELVDSMSQCGLISSLTRT
jgi:hypothetical protein